MLRVPFSERRMNADMLTYRTRTVLHHASIGVAVSIMACTAALPTSFAQDESQEELRRRAIIESYDDALLPTEDRKNAAIIYRQAFDLLASLSPEDNELLYSDALGGHIVSAEVIQSPSVRDLLARNKDVLDLGRRAANLDYAEFGIAREQGFGALMPHLNPMRQLGRLMTIQARVLRASGQLHEAGKLTADALRMSRHAASDHVLIGSLVGSACALRQFHSIEDAIAQGTLDEVAAQDMLDGLAADTPDPYEYSNALTGEYDLLLESIASMEDPGLELDELLFWSDGDDAATGFTDLTRDELMAMAEQLGPAYAQASAAFAEPDPKKARSMIAELEADIASGVYGELADLVMPTLDSALNTKLWIDEQIQDLEPMLRGIALGEDPARYANAALIYRPAFEYLRRIRPQDQELLEMIRQVVAVTGTCEALPESMLNKVRSILEESAPLIARLRTAARFERCEWNQVGLAKRQNTAISEGDWVRPMRAAARLLLADAALALCTANASGADEQDSIARSLADALAVILHLADGSHLFGEVTSAATLNELTNLLQTVSNTQFLSHEGIDRIKTRFSRVDSNDPLRWKESRENMMRESMYEVIMAFGLKDQSAAERLARSWSNDRIIMLSFFKESSDPSRRVDFLIGTNDQPGDLFSMTDLIQIDSTRLNALSAPHKRLIELLTVADETQLVSTNTWQADSMESLSQIEQILRQATKQLRTNQSR